ncbi:hypothetical protein VCHA54P496_300035 [Vibrio chagasii]|nr:hypothetical protein VCHA36P166_70008 [Vibrio chagasii]CAH7236714.1 hypothetical protein VCHA54P496_300035 [Vibrio chagasii]CAH7237895.1 hypothetical protein VCHA54P495_310035 [Vibrio chagasii]CAH7436585.1 hypothetical protein VCHA54P486_360035 [Vibrio chagasii]
MWAAFSNGGTLFQFTAEETNMLPNKCDYFYLVIIRFLNC